ncbi:MAG: WD40/YVTN/BNR-like repeat-containing protein [Gemmatimonadaceae bacterium]
MRVFDLRRSLIATLAIATGLSAVAAPATSQNVDPRLYAGLTWRNIGPFRGGRVGAVTGVIGDVGTFYAGFPGGGVWKTTSAGQTWYPVFDSVKEVSSVGAVEVAPSDPNVIYVGTGDMLTGGTIDQGNGVYKSTDAGKTWQHLGLEATQHIQTMMVDTRDPNIVMVGALGDPLKKSDARGIFRSTDGGKTWTRTLFVDDETGINKIARAFDTPNVLYATSMKHYAPPAYNEDRLRSPQFGLAARAPGDTTRSQTRLFKSEDNGVTWREVTGGGLPPLAGRTSVAVGGGTNAQRVYLITNAGLWRSDDGGARWRQMAADVPRSRNGQGGYNCGVYADPKNPDLVYTFATAAYKSVDGGKTFTGFKGAPGGDDPQQAWIDPTNGSRILFGYDQGLTVTLDAGATWSSWYNQSTEQNYHLAADNSFPYWVYATQQDAGAIRVRSRGNYGAISMFDWNSVNGWEWGTIVPNPLNTNEVFASGAGVVKITYPSEQWINVSPALDPAAKARGTSSMPLIWAPWNRHELILGLNFVSTTVDGGAHWTRISPELGIPKGLDSAAATNLTNGRGAIESLSASSVAKGVIWVGTSNGLIHVTRDEGKTWTDVSIPGLPMARRANVSAIDASHFAAGTAYAAIEYLRGGDHTPYLFRTRDFGKTWTKIVTGLPVDEPSGSLTRVIREDTRKAGLLFAGTESSLYVSFDDGAHWQPLANGLPNSPVRDLIIKGNDLIAATHGRGIWVLDDISTLRQLAPAMATEKAHLFAPGEAVRVRRNVNADTPLPPEIPHAVNPPDGAVIDYWLAAKPAGEITLDVFDAAGKRVRHFSSAAVAPVTEAARPPHPNFWLATPAGLPTDAGTNRVNWDLRYDAPPAFSHSFEINANPGLTPASPEGPLALPGVYTIKLSVDGATATQKVTVRNDPRSPATPVALGAQHALQMKLYDGIGASWNGAQQVATVRTALRAVSDTSAAVKAAVASVTAKLDSVAGGAGGRGFRGGAAAAPTFRGVNGALVGQLTAQDNADMAPTPAMLAAFAKACKDLGTVQAQWARVIGTDLPALNLELARRGKATLTLPVRAAAAVRCQ